MEMYQVLFNIVIGTLLVGVGWFLNTLYQAVRELEVNIPKLYVQKDDYREDMRDVKELLRTINDKLDNKQDKK